jgi:hypothetical protein
MGKRHATCACRQLNVSCTGDPTTVSLCHCLECQRRTGSTFGIAAFFFRENVKSTGQTKTFTRSSDSGHLVTFHFCPNCGTSVFWEPHRKPDMIAVAVGAFAEPSFPPPTKSVYSECQHQWIQFAN